MKCSLREIFLKRLFSCFKHKQIKKNQYNNSNKNSLSHGLLPRALNFNKFFSRILKTFASDVALESGEGAGGIPLVAPSVLQSSCCWEPRDGCTLAGVCYRNTLRLSSSLSSLPSSLSDLPDFLPSHNYLHHLPFSSPSPPVSLFRQMRPV